MKKRKRIVATILGLMFGIQAYSYKVYAEEHMSSIGEEVSWEIQNLLDKFDCSQGETVVMSVYLKGSSTAAQDISVMNGILEYDTSLFKVEQADILPVENEKVKTCSFDKAAGMFRVEYHSGITVQNEGILLKLQLNVAEDASAGKTTVCVTDMEWSEAGNGQQVKVENRVPARLTIVEAEKSLLLGDVNLDGRVDLMDVKLIMQYYNHTKTLDSQQKRNADVNGDEKINLSDAKLMMQYYNAEIDKF